MFIGYNLEIEDYYQQDFLKYKSNQKTAFIDMIDRYTKDGAVDGTRMEKDWFPMIDADIFISH